jgi:hypothetical protein
MEAKLNMHWEERVLLGVVIIISGLMLMGSFQYAPEARYFPQAAAILTLLFAGAIIGAKQIGITSSDATDVIGQVSEKSELETEDSENRTSSSDSEKVGKAGLGEFRIDLPTAEYTVPFSNYVLSHRATLSVLLLLYTGLFWLFGAFYSSVAFFMLYANVVKLRWSVFAALAVFIIGSLLGFGLWLETPLFRPGHEMFPIPGVEL